MDDLVSRLRTFPTLRPEGPEAADHIEALEARVAGLEADPRMKLTAKDILQTANACWASLYGEAIGDDPTEAILRIRCVLT